MATLKDTLEQLVNLAPDYLEMAETIGGLIVELDESELDGVSDDWNRGQLRRVLQKLSKLEPDRAPMMEIVDLASSVEDMDLERLFEEEGA